VCVLALLRKFDIKTQNKNCVIFAVILESKIQDMYGLLVKNLDLDSDLYNLKIKTQNKIIQNDRTIIFNIGIVIYPESQ
jgi:hypothetical protein